jgi:tRNA threonylcarbamoyl adenosine modification protein YeaZ/ribosomal-protein-alanine acetyltransferase
MAILCIDTSSSLVLGALVDPTTGEFRGGVSTGRAQGLLDVVDGLLEPGERDSIEALVVGVGPGGFTGLRVGVTTARGIAEALGVPLHGVGSLLVVAAATAVEHVGETVWGAIDAKRGEYFVQPFRADATGHVEAVGEPRAIPVAELETLDGVVATDADPAVLQSLTRAALQTIDAGGDGDPLTVLPAYVRGPDAEPRRLTLRIDRLVQADLGALDVIERRCFPHPWSTAMYAEELRRGPDEGVHLAARDDASGGRLVGAALAARIGDSWHVMNVLVDPSAQRRGVAGALIEELLRQTSERSVDDGWTLEVRTGNTAAIALYERYGFTSHGLRPGYYTDTGEDALIMWRTADVRASEGATS